MDRSQPDLASLEVEQSASRRIPTWLWEPDTVLGLMDAVALRLVVWPIQFALEGHPTP